CLRLWETTNAKLIRTLENGSFLEACFSPDGKTFATHGGRKSNEVTLWEAETGKQLRSWATGTTAFTSFAFAAEGRVLVTAEAGMIRGWVVETGKQRFQIPLGKPLPRALAISPDGKTLAVMVADEQGEGGSIDLWDVADPRDARHIAVPVGKRK